MVIDAVGDVQIEVERRLRELDESQHRAHFRRRGLHVVAIQIQILRGGAPTLVNRAALIRTIPLGATLVSIRVENRHEQEIGVIEQRRLAAKREVAEQHHACVLAVDLAGVNACLRQQRGQAGGRQLPELTHAAARGDDGDEQTTLWGATESLQRNERRGVGELLQPGDCVVVVGRISQVG